MIVNQMQSLFQLEIMIINRNITVGKTMNIAASNVSELSGQSVVTLDMVPQYDCVFKIDEEGIDISVPYRERTDIILLKDKYFDKTKNVFFLVSPKGRRSSHVQTLCQRVLELGYTPELHNSTSDIISLLYEVAESPGERAIHEEFAATKRFQEFIQNALDSRASDIHFCITGAKGVVKFRIDGVLVHKFDLPSDYLRSFVETIYTSFSEDREHPTYQAMVPQFSSAVGDFRLSKPYIGDSKGFVPHNIQVRVRKQSCPLDYDSYDEVWRLGIIDNEAPLPSFETLGYLPEQVVLLEKALRKPAGIILVCGTTGSGKTVTLASFLARIVELSGGTRCIRTIENPAEVIIPGTRQRSISDSSQYSTTTEVYMRLDPDVISIGELRDEGSAMGAASATLSGHPVLGSLHASDASTTVARLENLGIDKITLGEEGFLTAIINQSLIRLLCEHCKLPFLESRESEDSFYRSQLEMANVDSALDTLFGCGEGCDFCNGTGYSGRTVIAEVIEVTKKMKRFLFLGNVHQAMDYWVDEHPACVERGNPRSKLHHALILLSRGIVSPGSIVESCGALAADTT